MRDGEIDTKFMAALTILIIRFLPATSKRSHESIFSPLLRTFCLSPLILCSTPCLLSSTVLFSPHSSLSFHDPLPSLPSPLQKLKSTTGLFDLSFPQDSGSFSSEYNSLHDPYLKGYYYNNEAMRTKLIKSQFVTEDLYVRCSLKEYNEYRRFLENEFMKVCVLPI